MSDFDVILALLLSPFVASVVIAAYIAIACAAWATRPSDPRDLVARAHNRQETRP